MKWSKEAAQWAIAAYDTHGDVFVAAHECRVTIESLGHYRCSHAETAARWFRSMFDATPERIAERVATVRGIANGVAAPQGGL